jgi:hypothetical protein
MASADRRTTTFPTSDQLTTDARVNFTNPLRAAFVSGGRIRAADINLLRTAIVAFNGHTHSVLDYGAIAEFGNNGPRTVLSGNPRVSAAMTGGSTPTEVSAGTLVRATDVNTLVTAINVVRNHTHVIADTTTA